MTILQSSNTVLLRRYSYILKTMFMLLEAFKLRIAIPPVSYTKVETMEHVTQKNERIIVVVRPYIHSKFTLLGLQQKTRRDN